jgi:hypothetical protein
MPTPPTYTPRNSAGASLPQQDRGERAKSGDLGRSQRVTGMRPTRRDLTERRQDLAALPHCLNRPTLHLPIGPTFRGGAVAFNA